MGYYVRAFCAAETEPSLEDVVATAREAGIKLEADLVIPSGSGRWRQVLLRYDPQREPILAECNRLDDEGRELVREEIEEFREALESTAGSPQVSAIVSHLKRTRFIVSCRLPTSDMTDAGYDANALFLECFVEWADGMVYADGEGFYEGDEIIWAEE